MRPSGKKRNCLAEVSFEYLSAISLIFGFVLNSQAFCYVPIVDQNGSIKSWANPSLSFYSNPNNASQLTDQDVRSAIIHSLSRWKYAETAAVDFSFWQSPRTVSASVTYDGRNIISFQSANNSVNLGSGVIGVTYTYSIGNRIVEADIVLNDRNYIFSTNPTDSTQGSFQNRVFMENVLTHELGHAYGLAHSNQMQSSMLWQESKNQAYPHCEDMTGLGSLYPRSDFSSFTGSISGRVINSANLAVFGAYVHAIDLSRGVSMSTAITNANGDFVLTSLEPGSYTLMVEPFSNVRNALCGGNTSNCYWGGVNTNAVCGGYSMRRSFYAGDGALKNEANIVSVFANQTTQVSDWIVSCLPLRVLNPNESAGRSVHESDFPRQIAQKEIDDKNYRVWWGAFDGIGNQYYELVTPNVGEIKLKVLANGLYSAIDIESDITDDRGTSLANQKVDNWFVGITVGDRVGTPFVNFDSTVSASVIASQSIFAKIRNKGTLAYGAVPGFSAVDGSRFYLAIASLNEMLAALKNASGHVILPNNARCQKIDDFPDYPDQGEPPAGSGSRSIASSGGGGGSSVKTGCGTMEVIRQSIGKSQNKSTTDRTPRALMQSLSSILPNSIFSVWGLMFFVYVIRFGLRFYRFLKRAALRKKKL